MEMMPLYGARIGRIQVALHFMWAQRYSSATLRAIDMPVTNLAKCATRFSLGL